MTIWKFPLLQDVNDIEMPKGAKILDVHEQRDNPCIWTLVDPEAPKVKRHFRVIGTGLDFDPTGMEYIGTAHDILGWMVLHVFEKR